MAVRRRTFLKSAALGTLGWIFEPRVAFPAGRTRVSIEGPRFLINGRPTYEGRIWNQRRIEGLLLNARLVQGIFDDLNPETRSRWAYPDTGQWDPERNTREFVAAMGEWRRHGLLSFTLNLQGGSPGPGTAGVPCINSTFEVDGSLRSAYLRRLAMILDRADELGMVPIVSFFYARQDQLLRDSAAVVRGATSAATWLLTQGYDNVLVEIANQCDEEGYDHGIMRASRVHELIDLVHNQRIGSRRLYVGVSFTGGTIPTPDVLRSSDFVLLHGNNIDDPKGVSAMVQRVRRTEGYRSMPILFNEDPHQDFDRPSNNFSEALSEYASWGFYEQGTANYQDGFQSLPVNWGISTQRKRQFFRLLQDITGS